MPNIFYHAKDFKMSLSKQSLRIEFGLLYIIFKYWISLMPVWLQAGTNALNVPGSPLVVLGTDITNDVSTKPFSEWSGLHACFVSTMEFILLQVFCMWSFLPSFSCPSTWTTLAENHRINNCTLGSVKSYLYLCCFLSLVHSPRNIAKQVHKCIRQGF